MSLNAGSYRVSDLSRGMTLRNASENRRLAGHLQHLDLQLQQNLVNMQAEILDLKQSRKGMLPARHQRPKGSFGRTVGDPRQSKSRQDRSGPRMVSPLTIQGSSKEFSKPFLPQISTKNTALVVNGISVSKPDRTHRVVLQAPGVRGGYHLIMTYHQVIYTDQNHHQI